MFELKKLLSYDNHPNIIIYNCNNINNINSILNTLSDKKCNSNIYNGINYYSNDTYNIFDTKNINSKNILDFKSFINQIIKKSYNFTKKVYYNKKFRM